MARMITHPDNPPLRRPGIYLIRCLATGEVYVGQSIDVRNRFLKYSTPSHGTATGLLREAMDRFGDYQFEFVPVFYMTMQPDDWRAMDWAGRMSVRHWLAEHEAALIEAEGAAARGLNVNERWVGSYGERSRERHRAAIARRDANAGA